MFLPDRYVRGECPDCGTAGPVRRLLRELRRRPTRPPISSTRSRRSRGTHAGVARVRASASSSSAISSTMLRAWLEAAARVQPEVRAQARRVVRGRPARTGTSRATRPTSASRSRTRPASTSTSGSMRRSATSASFTELCARDAGSSFDDFLDAGQPARAATTSSARTSSTSTRCSGRRCCTARAAASRRACTCTASSPSTAQKMSKSRGTFITARSYLEHLDPEYLRYYFAAKLESALEDIDFNLDDFVAQGELRPRRQVREHRQPLRRLRRQRFGGDARRRCPTPRCTPSFAAAATRSATLYERANTPRRCGGSWRSPIAPTSTSTRSKPWVLAKDPAKRDRRARSVHQGLNLFRVL